MKTTRKRKRSRRPKLFVGSSVEGLQVAYAIQENLEHDAEPTVWPQGVFELSKSALQSLMTQLQRTDYGVFVFTPDDEVRLRNTKYKSVRDNVIFELGLFTGKLTPDCVFVVVPKDSENLRIPTDLVGTSLGTYDAEREDGNLQAALGPFCNRVRIAMAKSEAAKSTGKKKKKTKSPRKKAASTVRLVIHSAKYGIDRTWIDVKAPLRRSLKERGYALVGNDLAGDPKPGIVKMLKLDFSYGGTRKQAKIPEGVRLMFPQQVK